MTGRRRMAAWRGWDALGLSNEGAPCLPEMMFMSSQAEGGRVFDDRRPTWHGVPSWKGRLGTKRVCGALVRSTCAAFAGGKLMVAAAVLVCKREAKGSSGGARCRAEEAVAWRTLVVGLVGWPDGWLASAALSRCAWMWKQRLRFSEVEGESVEVELWMMC